MKALTCEMCGSTNLLKQDGVFVCQSCGTKYSVEEAKKMMVEGTVDVTGTVKVDTSDELKNLYEVARRAKDSNNSESAAKYYDMILVKDPKSWEANFYVPYFSAMTCKIAEISTVAERVSNNQSTTISLIKETLTGDEYTNAISEVISKSCELSDMLYNASISQFKSIDGTVRGSFSAEYMNHAFCATNIKLKLGEALYDADKETHREQILNIWKDATSNLDSICSTSLDTDSTVACQSIGKTYDEKIKELDPNYQGKSYSACYVATAVYGSYDCEEVWTLRRFRDYTLAETWYGRAFIHTYYAISPTLVKWFGNTEWFKKMWKEPLDNMVKKLQSQGVESTPYKDRVW